MAAPRSFAELFLGQDVEIVLMDASATNPPPGTIFPNEGILVAVDSYGAVLKRMGKARAGEIVFFPFSTIRCIRLRNPAAAGSRTAPAGGTQGSQVDASIVRGETTVVAERPASFRPPGEKQPPPQPAIFQPKFKKLG